MLSLFTNVKPLVTPKPPTKLPRPDNIVFKLHYKFTFAVLLVSCILVSSYSYIDSSGSAIQCTDGKSDLPDQAINRYCWIMSTFTLPKHYQGVEHSDFLNYGVGPYTEEDEQKYHAYYQWVPIMLFFQGIFFYAPHWIWKQLEGGKMKNVIVGLHNYISSKDERKKKVEQLSDYLSERVRNGGRHRVWAAHFFLCECLNFVNVVAQIFVTDAFLGGEFGKYGLDIIKFAAMDPENRVDPMSKVFPKVTKCTFHKYGPSGTIQRVDNICILGMNVINEKIYVFLWFWFVVLAVITGISLAVRLAQAASTEVRKRCVQLETAAVLGRQASKVDVEAVVSRLSYSDWLILYYLAQAMEAQNFGELLSTLADNLTRRRDSWSGATQEDHTLLANGHQGIGPQNEMGAATAIRRGNRAMQSPSPPPKLGIIPY